LTARCHHLVLLFKHKEESDSSLLCCLFRCNSTTENENRALPLFFLFSNIRKRQWQQVAITFFVATTP
jgi:hypothetical protein